MEKTLRGKLNSKLISKSFVVHGEKLTGQSEVKLKVQIKIVL